MLQPSVVMVPEGIFVFLDVSLGELTDLEVFVHSHTHVRVVSWLKCGAE